MQTILLLALAYFILGGIIGSFLGVCAYRIPAGVYEPTHEGVREPSCPVSIASPARSFCPCCEKQLLWWHTIPLVSWMLLRGRCAFCKAQIPFRYLAIEYLTGIVAVLSLLRFGPTTTGLGVFLFICALIVITYIDLDYMIIPDLITYPGTAIGVALALANYYLSPPLNPFLQSPFVLLPLESALGLAAGPGVLLLVWWFYLKVRKKEGLGLGDVKLLAMIGATFGPEAACFTILVGSIIGAVIGAAILMARKGSFGTYLPFGPYLALAASAYLLDLHSVWSALAFSTPLSRWWIHTLL
jgi:leader peptidase (prepilin peptidase)/N-methyltransferase